MKKINNYIIFYKNHPPANGWTFVCESYDISEENAEMIVDKCTSNNISINIYKNYQKSFDGTDVYDQEFATESLKTFMRAEKLNPEKEYNIYEEL